MKKQKLVIILVVLMLAGAGAGAYVAARIAPKSDNDASRQAQGQKIAANSGSKKSNSGDNSNSGKSNTDSKSKQDATKQPDKKSEKPQPKSNEQKSNPGSQSKPAPQSPSPAAPPKHSQQPTQQPPQPSNPQPPAPNPQSNPTPNPQPQPIDQDKKYDVGPPDAVEILELINNARSKENLQPLKMYEPLNQTAQWMANDMKENNYFSHYRPGTTIPRGLLKARSVCSAPAENLAQTSPPDLHTSRVAFNAWMQSPPHRQSIMSDKYTKTGFGIAGNKIVEHFC